MAEDSSFPVVCPTCGAANPKTLEWFRDGGDDFKCADCHAYVHLTTAEWLVGFRASGAADERDGTE